MVKQFKLIRKEGVDGGEPQWISYAGEPLDKFKSRLKEKENVKLDDYVLENADVELSEKGYEIIGKLSKLMAMLQDEVTKKEHLLSTTGDYSIPKPDTKPDETKTE